MRNLERLSILPLKLSIFFLNNYTLERAPHTHINNTYQADFHSNYIRRLKRLFLYHKIPNLFFEFEETSPLEKRILWAQVRE